MTVCTPEFEQVISTVPLVSSAGSTSAQVSSNEEARVNYQTDNFYSLISISGMTKTPLTVSEFLKDTFAALSHVQAVLAGESAEVLHVWIMVSEWTPDARKQVYALQKAVMKQLEGLQFDFYVVDLPKGMMPQEMVSDIPVIFHRAEQTRTPAHR
jgi:hypothetical protein